MLSRKIEDALNSQVAKEAYASNLYLSIASWCEQTGLKGCASFFYAQAEEEREHMMKVFKYINNSNGAAIAPAVKEPPCKYRSISQIFELGLEHETEVTKSINKLVELTFNTKDYASFNFLQWFVIEQQEEESLFRSLLDIIKLAGGGKPILLIDNEIGKIRNKA